MTLENYSRWFKQEYGYFFIICFGSLVGALTKRKDSEMQDYWQQVWCEALSDTDDQRQQSFVNLNMIKTGSLQDDSVARSPIKRRYRYHLDYGSRGPRGPAVFLGVQYPDVYLTCREAHCGFLLLKGMTFKAIASQLQISWRTVEYYVNNIKTKLHCRLRTEVVAHLLQSDFLYNLPTMQ
ncbi:MAG: helix-turn-helix transcriptional regulator [Coxiellaceae bacterium]|nr:helix-turn-helix transcriptional regulator [Coxiellaceae bacterium]